MKKGFILLLLATAVLILTACGPLGKTATSGNAFAFATNGDIITDVGFLATSGNAFATNGNFIATNGNFIATNGNAIATSGNAIATSGNAAQPTIAVPAN